MSKKPSLDESAALNEIDALLAGIDGVFPFKMTPIYKLVGGKLYELYVLSQALDELSQRGWVVSFVGSRIELKASPGTISGNEPHFELRHPLTGEVLYQVYTDIQVLTLGASIGRVNDRSAYHEIDIVVVKVHTVGMPSHKDLALGIECKATADFLKSHVREVLGRRRELSMYTGQGSEVPLALSTGIAVKANPPSEYWLRYIDPKGDHYRQSPSEFGVDLDHWQP